MTTATTPVRLNYGTQRSPLALPASYGLAPFYPDPGNLAPKQLDITNYGCFLDGAPITIQGLTDSFLPDQFLVSWINDSPNNTSAADDEELTLSFYKPTTPVGPFLWGTFEFEEDRSGLVAILCRNDASGVPQTLFLTGKPLAQANPPAPVYNQLPQSPGHGYLPPVVIPQPAGIDEMLTLTFPGLTQATSDAMSDDFSWALDQQWRAKLVAATRPDIAANLPPAFAQQRLTFLDSNAEWFNAVFGPSALGMQLYQDSLPNAPNRHPLHQNLTPAQLTTLTNFLHGPLGHMPQAQQEHLLAARSAHFNRNPRLQLYAAQGQAFLNRLLQPNGALPSVSSFLAVVALGGSFQSCSLKLASRYAGVLGAFDLTGALEQQFHESQIGAVLLSLSQQVQFTDQADMASAFSDLFEHILSNPQENPTLTQTITQAVSEAKSVVALGLEVAALINKASLTVPLDSSRILRIATTASSAFSVQFPKVALSGQVFYALCLGYSVYASVRMYMNWTTLSATQRLDIIAGNFQQIISAIGIGKSIYDAVDALGKTEAEVSAAVAKLNAAVATTLDAAKSSTTLVDKIKAIDPQVVEKANAWLKNISTGWDNFKVSDFFAGFGLIGKVLGPITAIAAVAQSIYQLFNDIKSGAGIRQIALDSVNVAVDTALVVCAAIDLVVDLFAVTVIGIVLVAVALLATAIVAVIGWIFGKRKPQDPADDYMQHVVFPFVNLITPKVLPPPPNLLFATYIRGQLHGA